ncbi:hypothetical protein AVEN_222185-1 [Araneus ventricosus]|uniref:Uncharacterized protein n=1 Tax=Araneus ventricosus TaxID=182803 RepID=A0A4Y2NAC9_ARAVE|nr:hypothetical protein AVEN_222185-1 [Araneus ventricosus]
MCAGHEEPSAFVNVGQIEPHGLRAAVLKGQFLHLASGDWYVEALAASGGSVALGGIGDLLGESAGAGGKIGTGVSGAASDGHVGAGLLGATLGGRVRRSLLGGMLRGSVGTGLLGGTLRGSVGTGLLGGTLRGSVGTGLLEAH